jgi:hypothetical protein
VVSRFKSRILLSSLVLLWCAGVGAGVAKLVRYSNTPGVRADAPQHWPAGTSIHPKTGRPVLLVFAHPRCPCSDATIGELALIMAQATDRVDAFVLLYTPRTGGSDFARTQLARDAELIPGVHLIDDPDGIESRRFGAFTSGQTLFYDANGALRFSGGITASRGHAGGNFGRSAVLSLLETGRAPRRTTPVFGCSIRGEE